MFFECKLPAWLLPWPASGGVEGSWSAQLLVATIWKVYSNYLAQVPLILGCLRRHTHHYKEWVPLATSAVRVLLKQDAHAETLFNLKPWHAPPTLKEVLMGQREGKLAGLTTSDGGVQIWWNKGYSINISAQHHQFIYKSRKSRSLIRSTTKISSDKW